MPTTAQLRGSDGPVLETVSHPRLAVGDTTSSICQQLDVAKRCLIWGVKWHVSPRRSHCPNDTMRLAKRNKVTSQRRRRRIETRFTPTGLQTDPRCQQQSYLPENTAGPRPTGATSYYPSGPATPSRTNMGGQPDPENVGTPDEPKACHRCRAPAAGATLTTKGDVQHYASGCERADTRRPSYGSDNSGRPALSPARSSVQLCANSRRAAGLRNSRPDRRITTMPSRWS